jgi:hypothetical protein
VHVAGGHHGQVVLGGQPRQHVVHGGVGRPAVVGELDVDRVGAEQVDQTAQCAGRVGRAAGGERLAHEALAAAGEHVPVPAALLGQLLEVVDRSALLVAGQLRLGDGGGQPVVALHTAGEHEQVAALGVGHPLLRCREAERQLRAEDRRQAQLLCRLGEAGHTVEAVVVGQGQRLQPEVDGLLDQDLGGAGAVEEAEVAVAVQLGVRHGRRLVRAVLPPAATVRGVGSPVARALTAERGTVPAIGEATVDGVGCQVLGAGHRAAPVGTPVLREGVRRTSGEPRLELAPGDVGVVPAHQRLPLPR